MREDTLQREDTETSSTGARGGPSRLRPERVKELTLVGIIVVTIVVFSFLADDYLTGRFFNRVTTSVVIIGVLALAQTLVIVTRNIDLSVGSIVGVSAYVTGEVLVDNPDTHPLAAIGLAMLIGCGLGLLNGTIVVYGQVPAIVVTLGTMALYRAWLIEHGEGQTITVESLPDWVAELPQRTVISGGDLDLRLVTVVLLGAVVVLQFALGRLRWGRRLYAIGSNPEAAVQAGLPQRRLVLSAFASCGALSGLAGFLFLARFGTITVSAGEGMELESVAAAVVGGVSILGGAGTVLGALLGAVLVNLLDQSLTRVDQVGEFWRHALLGALVLLAVISDVVLGQRFRRRLEAEAAEEAEEAVISETAAEAEGPGTAEPLEGTHA